MNEPLFWPPFEEKNELKKSLFHPQLNSHSKASKASKALSLFGDLSPKQPLILKSLPLFV